MASKIYCFFCESCGNDTVAYEMYRACPYCRTHHGKFKLLITSDGPVNDEVRKAVEDERAKWISGHRRKKGSSESKRKSRKAR